ncbi:MAG: Fe-S protein assembly co-chaperone HscB [Gammaproteobacteria bacterium]|nr:Fe-S protein assembly co-chaperone HscB [Gammaproteobacteria bacterium]|tara:strand:+ start:225209 stop:225712 length:504 start_codon:yes stop_codon:yes gene_type:complete
MDILKKNYFDLFGIEISIEIKKSTLEKKYKELQRQFHPDKYSQSTTHEKKISAQISSYINDAYITLSDLIKRINYILKINNFNKDESVTLKNEDFLIEQIDHNEFIENINSKTAKEIKNYKDDIVKKLSSTIIEIKSYYEKKDFQKVWEELSKLQFYVNHINKLEGT